MSIQEWSETIWLAKLNNEPSLSDDLLQLVETVSTRDPAPDVVLDMSNLTQINSSNLSQLLRLRKAVIDKDRRLRLAAISDPAWAIFLTTGLDKVFEFTEDVPSALASLQM